MVAVSTRCPASGALGQLLAHVLGLLTRCALRDFATPPPPRSGSVQG